MKGKFRLKRSRVLLVAAVDSNYPHFDTDTDVVAKKNDFLHFPHFVKSLLDTPNVDILNRFCDEKQLFIRVLRNCLSLDSSWTHI